MLERRDFFLWVWFVLGSTTSACSSTGNPLNSLEDLMRPPANKNPRRSQPVASAEPKAEARPTATAPEAKESEEPAKKTDPYSVIDPF